MQLNKRKHPRLNNKNLYSTRGSVAHIIIGTYKKTPYFKNHDYAEGFLQFLINTAGEKENKLYAYCIMPDHIHILPESSEHNSIIDYVRLIKGRFTSHCRKLDWNIKLQKSFYDHLVRKEDDIRMLSKYIMGNPVRAGIESAIGVYPFAGSLVFEMEELLNIQ